MYVIPDSGFYDGNPILFSRLDFDTEIVVAFTPKTRDMPNSDAIGIWYPKLIDAFENYFRIVSPDEYGLTTPIPMPFHVEDN